VHFVGFIIRMYHNARSSECQIPLTAFSVSYSVHTPNKIGGKHPTFLTPLPILLTCLYCEQEPLKFHLL